MLRPQQKFFLLFVLAAAAAFRAYAQVELGTDVLEREGFSILEGKRVGLVTNQTGVDSRGVKTRLVMRHARNFRLVALFSPEHGLDGVELAGRYVASHRDSLTGLPVYSLYGPTRKPTPQMLAGLDVLVFDMQDIGSRSYTYVSTMVKCMEAAGESRIPFVVLDRPNPLGGMRIEGPPIEARWISFVGQLPVPYVHGMTVGELARMANGMGWVRPRCALTVISMRGWHRQMTWPDTGLRWVPTSPNVPYAMSPFYYVVTGIIGELAGLEIGIGGSEPFEIVAAKWLDGPRFTASLRALNFEGVAFTDYYRDGFQGARIRIDPHSEANLSALGMYILAYANAASRPDLFERSPSKLEMFYKCYGSTGVRSEIETGVPVPRIVNSWLPSIQRFDAERSQYLLY